MEASAVRTRFGTGKKLIQAGYELYSGVSLEPSGEDGTDEDAKYMQGMPVELLQADAVSDFVIDFENLEALEFFLGNATQWRVISGMKIVIQGLDYTSLLSVLALYKPKRKQRQRLFEKIQLLERGALHAIKGKPFEDLFPRTY